MGATGITSVDLPLSRKGEGSVRESRTELRISNQTNDCTKATNGLSPTKGKGYTPLRSPSAEGTHCGFTHCGFYSPLSPCGRGAGGEGCQRA